MGGIVIWASVVIVTLGLWIIDHLTGNATISKFDFLSRNQTWLPLSVLLFGALVGLVDDYLEIKGSGGHIAGGLSLRKRLFIVGVISFLCAYWFYFKLGVSSIGLPFAGSVPLGAFFIPFFVLVTLALYSGGVIDGIDGLAGGVFASIFAAYGGIAFAHHQTDLAAFCAVVVGSILAFLWFNIPPARYYMSETGSMALTITLAVVAFMTGSAMAMASSCFRSSPFRSSSQPHLSSSSSYPRGCAARKSSGSRRSIITSRRSAGRPTRSRCAIGSSA